MNRTRSVEIRRRESLFFVAMAIAMTLVVFTGFARSFFLSFLWSGPDPNASPDAVYYVHGSLAAAWMVLAVTQPLLITTRRVHWHRRTGWIGAGLAAAVVMATVLALLLSAARPPDAAIPPTPLDFLGVLLSNIAMFGLFVGLAIMVRRDGPSHKRFMFLATLNLLQAAVVRLPVAFLYSAGPVTTFLVSYAFVAPLVIWDLAVLRRIHPVTLWGGLGIFVSLPTRLWVSHTEAWLMIARGAVRFVS
jgi:hypothetical protein